MATAIYDGDTRSVQSMINDGVDLNRISKGGMTYLYYAMLTMNYDMMELLLKNGANPNIHSDFYTRPDLHEKGLSDDKSTGVCLEYSGYRAYDIKYMKLLLKHGANINDTTYISPLSIAVQDQVQGKEKIKYLAEQGIDLNFSITNTPIICGQAAIYKLTEYCSYIKKNNYFQLKDFDKIIQIQYDRYQEGVEIENHRMSGE